VLHLRPTAELAERVLLPGDPGRALMLAQALIAEPRMFNHHRGLWGYTGPARADGEPLEVLMHRIWDYIEILRGPHVAVSTDRKPADGDVLDTMFLQVLQQRDRVKRVGHP